MENCTECGFTYADVSADALPDRIAGFGPRYATALTAAPEPRRRPAPEVWSPLEYTCHVRDVLDVQRDRLRLALRETAPEFPPMGRDERAVLLAYNRQDPDEVLRQLTAAALTLAAAFGELRDTDWGRVGVYPWPERRTRTMLWLGQHTVHEGEHHLRDISSPSTEPATR
ncbi:DinB family protein [Jidongwangia harbinensis]|uniref:DinB family protein n=1 Tax=Jidongwangia harbinensis TaxID=2878561 RepID=UPI001CD989BB|nr:DinB family protein [Jidongwangia harbinensis]MCA2213155.1 DinB family protein [Jidongwangia harbinensis]